MSSFGMRNLTDSDEELLAQLGITRRAEFEKLGAQKTFLLLQESGLNPDRNMLYRLKGAERDIDWQILAKRDHRRAKSRFADVDEP